MHDIVIVGAGPAGSSFAKFSAEQGFSVAVIDTLRLEQVWSKPCGNGLVERQLSRTPLSRPRGDELYGVAKDVHVYSPDYSFRVKFREKTYLINRTEFGRRVLEEAMAAGAAFLEGTGFRKVIFRDGRVAGIVSSRGELRARLVVDASGSQARVKSQLPAEWPVAEKPPHVALCMRGIFRLDSVEEPETLKVYTDQSLAPRSYWWNFPHGGDMVNVGVGVMPGDYARLKELYRGIVARLPVRGAVQEGGAYLPVSRPPLSLVGPGVLVLGDAAPTVNPLTGEGMGPSILAAHLAAEQLPGFDSWSHEELWAMNEYLRREGADAAAADVLKRLVWSVDAGELQGMMSLFRRKLNLLKLPFHSKLRRALLAARALRNHYRNYPTSPGLDGWSAELRRLEASITF